MTFSFTNPAIIYATE